MNISCGEEIIEISKVSYVAIAAITDYDLDKLEKEFNGDCPEYDLYEQCHCSYDPFALPTKKNLSHKFEKILNKYWYEVGLLLPHPKPEHNACDSWEYASTKQSSFSVGWIDSIGDSTVTWSFTADYGTDPAGYRHAGKKEIELSLKNDIIPVLKRLSRDNVYRSVKQKSKSKSGLFQFAMEILLPDAFGNPGNDVKETPNEMIAEIKAIYDEWHDTYEKAIKEKLASDERLKKRSAFLKKYSGKSVLRISTDEKEYKYLEGCCGFDIYSKKQEIEKELELYKEKRSAKIKSKKETLIAKITSEFYEKNLLSNPLLSNREKLKAYSNILDFCRKYIPLLAERGFALETLYSEYSEFISETMCNAFKENWIRLNRSYSVLSRGANGEEKVYEVLRLFDDRIHILKDYVWGHEHDFVVITPYGISTIEVKNLRGDYVLTETGILKCLSSRKVKPKDVALQSKKHLETLRRNLSGCSAFSANIPMQEIICSAESNFTIRDDYHYIPVCYYNTVDKALFPENMKPVLNEKSMDLIEKYLLDNRGEAFKFEVFLPRGEIDNRDDFIKCFADIASGYIVAQNKSEES